MVGSEIQNTELRCNPYLLVEGEEGILIDPGSSLDFAAVRENVEAILPLEKIRYIILHHQDPDLCGSVLLFEEAGLKNAMIVTHWRTAFIVIYYGFSSPIYQVDEHDFKLTFGNNRELWFIATPYLHAPGAITTFDPKTRTLFSSDIFGAFTPEWKLFANYDYIPHMRTFHVHYMPGSAILDPILDTFEAMDAAMICPQHGSIIREDIPRYIEALKDLPGVSMFHPGFSGFLKDKERKINQLEEENEKLKKNRRPL